MESSFPQTPSGEQLEPSAEQASECSTLQASISSSQSDSFNPELKATEEAADIHRVCTTSPTSSPEKPSVATTSTCPDANNSQSSPLPMPQPSCSTAPGLSTPKQPKVSTKPPSSLSPNDFIYHIKWIKFQGTSRPIITQNENGPCPIIAIGNVLFLRGTMSLAADTEVLTGQRLVSLLSDILLSHPVSGLDDGQLLNYETTVADAFNLFPSLQTGLDINVRFTGVSAFEFTPALSVFDLFRISLFHGWLVDPENLELISIVGDRTYNQLVEQVIQLKASVDPDKIAQGVLAEEFVAQTTSQLTYHGLCELYSAVSDGQLAVFFRNNHFNTIYKTQGRIYVLVTDQYLSNEPNIVWEVLNDVDGNTQFVDEAFQLYSPPSSVSDTTSVSNRPVGADVVPPELTTAPGAIRTAAESGNTVKPRTTSSSHKVPEPDATSTTSVDELARACSEHLKLESSSTKKIDDDLSLAVKLQLVELKSNSSVADQHTSSVRPEPTAGTRKPALSSDNLSKICSGQVLELAKEQLGSGSDLDMALRLQWEEMAQTEQNRAAHPTRSNTDPAYQRRRHSAATRQAPQPHSGSRSTVSQRSTSSESRENCTIL